MVKGRGLRKGAEVAKHPTGVYLQGSWVQGEQALTFFFSFKKKVSKEKCALRKDAGEFRPLRRATRAPPWTCRPLKRAAPNFRPYRGLCGAKGGAWSLGLMEGQSSI